MCQDTAGCVEWGILRAWLSLILYSKCVLHSSSRFHRLVSNTKHGCLALVLAKIFSWSFQCSTPFFLWESLTDALLKPPSNIASWPRKFFFNWKRKVVGLTHCKYLFWIYFVYYIYCCSPQETDLRAFCSSVHWKICFIRGYVWSHVNYINGLKVKVFA